MAIQSGHARGTLVVVAMLCGLAAPAAARAPDAAPAGTGTTQTGGGPSPVPAAKAELLTAATPDARDNEQGSDAAPEAASLSFVHGFADIGAAFSGDEGNDGFGHGTLDLYFTPQLSDHVKALGELVFEYNDLGELAVDLERLQIGYAFSGGSTVWLGRFHTPLGYWNTAFHHGQQIQTAISRPRFIDFEDRGGVVPTHTVGVLATGGRSTRGGRVRYDLFLGNSPTLVDGVLDPGNAGHQKAEVSVGFNLSYRGRPGAPVALGIHGYSSDVREEVRDSPVTRLRMFGGYVGLESDTWDIVAEYYAFHDRPSSGERDGNGSWAGFAQVGRRLGQWIPYGRLERATFDSNSGYFGPQPGGQSYDRQALGLRRDLGSTAAIKAEALHTNERASSRRFTGFQFQWAVRF